VLVKLTLAESGFCGTRDAKSDVLGILCVPDAGLELTHVSCNVDFGFTNVRAEAGGEFFLGAMESSMKFWIGCLFFSIST
jgi:hypothetical protein